MYAIRSYYGLKFGDGAKRGSGFNSANGNANGTCGYTNEDGTTGMRRGKGMNGAGSGMGRGRR